MSEVGVRELEKQNVVGDVVGEEIWCQIIKDFVKFDKDFGFCLRWEVFGLGWWWGGSGKWLDLIYF